MHVPSMINFHAAKANLYPQIKIDYQITNSLEDRNIQQTDENATRVCLEKKGQRETILDLELISESFQVTIVAAPGQGLGFKL